MEFVTTLAQFGIDPWSMLFYLINFVVLAVALTYLLYRPVLRFLEQRQSTIAASVQEAQHLQMLLDQERIAMAQERERLRTELASELQELKKRLREEEERLQKDMEEKRAGLLADAYAQIEREKNALLQAAEAKTLETITVIVEHILQNNVPQEVVKKSVADAWDIYSPLQTS